MKCRHCHHPVEQSFIDLGTAPPSNAYLTAEQLRSPETYFPLRVSVCTHCWLVQTEDFAQAEDLFDSEYAYFSSFSQTWLDHAQRYVTAMTKRFELDSSSLVVEVAANDGYLLQYFQALNIPCLGIEPTASTAAAARAKGLEIVEAFFGVDQAQQLVEQGKQADLMAANNVLAHVPDINDFLAGFAILLKPQGVVTFEFPHLLQLVQNNQFDTIYHEHFSYLSLVALKHIFAANGLSVFDVESLPTHGGSLRVFAQRQDSSHYATTERVQNILQQEMRAGLLETSFYQHFQSAADRVKDDFLRFLLTAKEQGKTVVGYGAAAKGNTLLNYAGVRSDLIAFVCDRNPAKQGKFMPGSRIPILEESQISILCPDYVVIFPWNIKAEVMAQLAYVREWNGQFVTAVPHLEVLK
ncbi:MAG: class I SAM-dependent methyltransferase [Cyanobacteria bacterium P01_H01_bin.15]